MQVLMSDRCGTQPARKVHVLSWQEERACSARDLIKERVRHEFSGRGLTSGPQWMDRHLVQYPFNAGCSLCEAMSLALQAFAHGSFYLFVNDRQVFDLDASFTLDRQTEVTFVRLLPNIAA